jgi:hypothetical protein
MPLKSYKVFEKPAVEKQVVTQTQHPVVSLFQRMFSYFVAKPAVARPKMSVPLEHYLKVNCPNTSKYDDKIQYTAANNYTPLMLALSTDKQEFAEELLKIQPIDEHLGAGFRPDIENLFTVLFSSLIKTKIPEQRQYIIDKMNFIFKQKIKVSITQLFQNALAIITQATNIEKQTLSDAVLYFRQFLYFAMENDPIGTSKILKTSDFLMDYAVKINSVELAKLFLDYGVEVTDKSVNAATEHDRKELIKMWRDRGLNIIQLVPIAAPSSEPQDEMLLVAELTDKIEIDDKLMGHIHNDRVLTGTTLEGIECANSIKYLNQFIKTYKEQDWRPVGLKGSTAENYLKTLEKIQKNFSACLKIREAMILNCRNSKLVHFEDALNKICDLISSEFKENCEVLFPGGWSAYPFGHAMLYEIKKNAQGTYVLLIYNTGAGIDEHASRSTTKGIYHASLKAFEFPMSDPISDLASQENYLRILLRELISPMLAVYFKHEISAPEDYNAVSVYRIISDTANKLGLTEVDPKPYTKILLKGQNSGTCAMRVISSYIKNFEFEGDSNYQDVRYELRRYSIWDYYQKNLRDKRLNHPTVQRQLHYALQNFALLLTNMDNSPLSAERRKMGLELIGTVSKGLKENVASVMEGAGQKQTASAPFSKMDPTIWRMNFSLWLSLGSVDQKSIVSANPLENFKDDRVPASYTLLQFDAKSPARSLEELNTLCRNNLRSQNYSAICQCIEKFYLSVPIKPEIWQTLSKGELKKCLTTLESINSMYASSCAKQDFLPFANRYVTLVCGEAIADTLLTNYFRDLAKFSALRLRIPSYTRLPLQNNSYCVSTSLPHIEKLSELTRYFSKNYQGDSDHDLLYYIILRNPKTNALLSKKVNEDGVFQQAVLTQYPGLSKDGQCVLYFLTHIDKLKQSFPELYEDVETYLIASHIEKTKEQLSSGQAQIFLRENQNDFNAIENFIKNSKFSFWQTGQQWNFQFRAEENCRSAQEFRLEKTQPSMLNKAVVLSLNSEGSHARTCNTILVDAEQPALTEDRALQRSLFLTQLNKATKISATLDLLHKEFFRFDDMDFQSFAFISLFEVGLLTRQLDQTPEIVFQLIALIHRGLGSYVVGNRIKPPALFFFKLACCLQGMLSQMKSSPTFIDAINQLQETQDKGVQLIEANKHSDEPQTVAALWNLHSYNLISLSHRLVANNGQCSQDELQQILVAMMYRRKRDPLRHPDPFIEFEVSCALAQCESYLIKKLETENISALLTSVLSTLDVPYPNTKSLWVGQYPQYYLMNDANDKQLLAVDLQSGYIYEQGDLLAPLPAEVYNNPLFTQFFTVKPSMARISADKKCYEFKVNHCEYRFIINSGESGRQAYLHKKINGNWYQYSDTKSEQIPASVLEQGNVLWLSTTPGQDAIIVNELTQQPMFTVRADTILQGAQNVLLYNRDGAAPDLWLLTPKYKAEFLNKFPHFKQFEALRFIELYSNVENNLCILKMPRYGLEFKLISDAYGQAEWVWIQDPRYKVDFNHVSFISGFAAELLLTARYRNKVDDMVLIPKQQFIATDKEEHEYYQLEFDTSAQIFVKTLGIHNKFKDHDLLLNPQFTLWSAQEKYATYPVNSVGELVATSHEDSIYLAYLYLANKQPLLAFNSLRLVLREDKPLSAEQFDWLYRILKEIPAPLGNATLEKKATIVTPETMAVQALSGYIIAQHALNKSIVFEAETQDKGTTLGNMRSANKEYHAICLEKRNKLLTEMGSIISDTYDKYYKKTHKIPVNMQLSEQEEECILLFSEESTESQLPSHLHYRKDKLAMQNAQRGAEKIEQNSPVETSHTEIQQHNIVVLPDEGMRLITPYQKNLFDSIRETKPISIETSEDEFMQSFQHYYTLIRGGDSVEKQQLLSIVNIQFHRITMQVNRKQGMLSFQDNLIILLSYVALYPNEFPEGPILSKSIPNLVDIMVRLQQDYELLATVSVTKQIKGDLLEVPLPNEPYKSPVPVPLDDHALSKVMPILEIRREELDQEIRKHLKHLSETTRVLSADYEALNEEYRLGQQQNRSIMARNETSEIYFTPENIHTFSAELSKSISIEESVLAHLKRAILNLANKLPDDPIQRTLWELQKHGSARFDLGFEHILHLYLTQDLTQYRKLTCLNEAEITKLNTLIYDFLLRSTNKQHYQRVLVQMNKTQSADLSPDEKITAVHEAGALLQLKRCYEPKENPRLMLFEYLDNKLIYPKQYDYLNYLVNVNKGEFNSQVVQLIMGGGKSKLLMPLLALLKANGQNLSIVVVPDSLFHINKADLNEKTQKIFGKKAHAFYFNDAVDCSLSYLKNLKEDLKSAIRERDYLVTTKESLQSLQLHYLKLLMSSDQSEAIQQKRNLLNEILHIIKYQGDPLVDEVDSALDIRKQLIYSLGKGGSVPAHTLKCIIDLYAFFENVRLPKEEFTLADVFTEKKKLSAVQLDKIISVLAEEWVKHQYGSMPGAKQQQLISYLLGKENVAWLSTLTDTEQDDLAVVQQEISQLLRLTLARNRNEHFGLPNHKSQIPVPYLASNTPSTSEFGNYLETINYTIQVHREGLPFETVKQFVADFRRQHEEECKNANSAGDSALKRFKQLTGYELDATDFDTAAVFKDFYDQVRTKKVVKDYCMQNYILGQITKNNQTLASSSHNFAALFRSFQGMTGTPWNHTCYPNFIKFNKEISQGVDGQTLNNLLKTPIAPHLLPKTDTIQSLIQSLFIDHAKMDSIHAWIDAGALFRGVSNHKIAQEFSQIFKAHKSFSHLRYVLYFGSDDKLYALSTSANGQSQPILLENTEPEFIKQKLQCDTNEYFTYYDQRHTLGVDIKQAHTATAFVTIGMKTMLHDLLQAVMRMRELSKSQHVEFVVPQEVQEAYPEIKEWNVENIIQFCYQNEINRLKEDNYKATLLNMQNVIWEDCYIRLLNAPTDQERTKLMTCFMDIFVSSSNKRPFEQFGEVRGLENTQLVLSEFAKRMITKWHKAVGDSSVEESQNIAEKLENIVTEALPNCPEKVEKLPDENSLDDKQVEMHRQVDLDLDKEISKETDYQIKGIIDARPISEYKISSSRRATLHELISYSTEEACPKTLEQMAETHKAERAWCFSDNLYVSRNFALSCEVQPDLVDSYKKDVVFYLVELDENNQKINFLLITPEEAAAIQNNFIEVRGGRRYWIETTHQIPFCGHKPKDLPREYDQCLEQIALFAGDTDILNSKLKEGAWLLNETQDKLQFLEQVIMPVHPDKNNLLQPLQRQVVKMLGDKESIARKQQAYSKEERAPHRFFENSKTAGIPDKETLLQRVSIF